MKAFRLKIYFDYKMLQITWTHVFTIDLYLTLNLIFKLYPNCTKLDRTTQYAKTSKTATNYTKMQKNQQMTFSDQRTIFSGSKVFCSLTSGMTGQSPTQGPLSMNHLSSVQTYRVMGGSLSHVAMFLSQYLRSTFHNLDSGYLLRTSLLHTQAFGKLEHPRLFGKHVQLHLKISCITWTWGCQIQQITDMDLNV